jgi:hypothetical protein
MAYITKADNTDDLNSDSSWVGGVKPTSVDAANYASNLSGANATNLTLSSPATWGNITIDSSTPMGFSVRQKGTGLLTLLPTPVVNNIQSYKAITILGTPGLGGKRIQIDHPIKITTGGYENTRIFDCGPYLYSTDGINLYGSITSTEVTNIIRKDGASPLRLYADSPNHIGGWNIYQGNLEIYSAGALGTGTVKNAQGSNLGSSFIIDVPPDVNGNLPNINNTIRIDGNFGYYSSIGIQWNQSCTHSGTITVGLSSALSVSSLPRFAQLLLNNPNTANGNVTVTLNGDIIFDPFYTSKAQIASNYSLSSIAVLNLNGSTSGPGTLDIDMGGYGRVNLVGAHSQTGGITITSGVVNFNTTSTTTVATTIGINATQGYTGAIELGGRFPTLASINSPTAISTSSTGSVFLIANSSENINWSTNGYQLYLGSVTDGVVYSGTITPASVSGVPTYKFVSAQGKTFTVDTVLSGASNADIWVQDLNSKIVLNKTNTLTGTVLLRGGNCSVAQPSGLLSATAVTLGNASSIGSLLISDTSATPLKLQRLIIGRSNSRIHIV